MKYWILSLFYLFGRMDKLCERIEEEIDRLSCDLKTDTYRLFEAVLALSDKRTRLINFKVIGSMMKDCLTDAQGNIMNRRMMGASLEQIGQALGVSKATVSRRFLSAVSKCAALAGRLTFTEDRLENEYRDIPLIYRTVQKFRREHRKESNI